MIKVAFLADYSEVFQYWHIGFVLSGLIIMRSARRRLLRRISKVKPITMLYL
jgi:hypothetical protein